MKTDSNILILNSLGSGHAGSSGNDYYADLAEQYAFLVDKILCDQEVCIEEEASSGVELEVLIPIIIIVVGIIGAALFFALKRAGKFRYFRLGK